MKRCRVACLLLAGLLLGPGVIHAASEFSPVAAVRWRAGVVAAQDGLHAVAERELKGCLKIAMEEDREGPAVDQALVLLAHVMLARGRGEALLEFVDEHRRWLRRRQPGAEAYLRAMAHYHGRAPAEVLKELARFERDYPQSPFAPGVVRLQAWSHWHLGDTNAALRLFAAYDARFPGTPEAAANRLEWGQLLVASGRLDEAEKLLSVMPPEGTDVRSRAVAEFWRGRLLLEAGRTAEAAVVLEGAVEAGLGDPDLIAEAWFAVATARLAMGDRPGAAGALQRGVVVARGSELLLRGSGRLGLLYLDMGRLDEGVSLLRQYVTAVPDGLRAADTQMAVARALLAGGRPAEAQAAYQYYLESYTNLTGVAQAHLGRGWALMDLDRFAEAAAAFEKAYVALVDPSEREVALGKVADAHFADQRYALARETYERLLAEFPGSAQRSRAYYQRAQALALAGQRPEALVAYRELAEQYPEDPLAEESLLRVAQLHEADEQHAEAATAYGVVLDRFPNGAVAPAARLGRGLSRYRLMQFAEALTDFEALVTHHPAAPQAEEARYHIVMCRYLVGQEEAALAAGRQFQEQYPESTLGPRMRFWLGQRAFNAGAYVEAERYFMEFQALHAGHPDRERALLWAARAASRREEFLRSLEILTLFLRDFPTSTRLAEARYDQGNALAALGKFPEAILAYQEVINRSPQSDLVPDAWLHVGDSHFMLGIEDESRYTQAVSAYRVAGSLPNAGVDLRLQCEYKIGRCLQSLGQVDAAIDQYYRNVLTRFLEVRESGGLQSESARMWCGRAARDLAGIFESRQEWRQVVNVLERALQAGVSDEAGLRERIREIRARQWWEFY